MADKEVKTRYSLLLDDFKQQILTISNKFKGLNQELKSVGKSMSTSLSEPLKTSADQTMGVANDMSEGFKQKISSISDSFKGLNQQIKRVGRSMTIALTVPLTAAAGYSMKVASDLAEVQNVVDTAFKESAETVNEWSSTLLETYGLNELQAKQFAGTLRAMTGSMGLNNEMADKMSLRLTELVGDISSFYNLDHDTAFNKIGAGISGEIEPLRQLGINMSVANLEAYALTQGITKQYDKMSEAEKTLLRYNYLLDVTKDAQGDFSKTQDSAANQMRVLKGEVQSLAAGFGEEMLPVLQSILKEITPMIRAFRDLDPEVKKIIIVIGGLVAITGPLLIGIAAVNTALMSLSANPIVLVLAAIVVGVVALTYAMHELKKESEAAYKVVSNILKFTNIGGVGGQIAAWLGVPTLEKFDEYTEKAISDTQPVKSGNVSQTNIYYGKDLTAYEMWLQQQENAKTLAEQFGGG